MSVPVSEDRSEVLQVLVIMDFFNIGGRLFIISITWSSSAGDARQCLITVSRASFFSDVVVPKFSRRKSSQ